MLNFIWKVLTGLPCRWQAPSTLSTPNWGRVSRRSSIMQCWFVEGMSRRREAAPSQSHTFRRSPCQEQKRQDGPPAARTIPDREPLHAWRPFWDTSSGWRTCKVVSSPTQESDPTRIASPFVLHHGFHPSNLLAGVKVPGWHPLAAADEGRRHMKHAAPSEPSEEDPRQHPPSTERIGGWDFPTLPAAEALLSQDSEVPKAQTAEQHLPTR